MMNLIGTGFAWKVKDWAAEMALNKHFYQQLQFPQYLLGFSVNIKLIYKCMTVLKKDRLTLISNAIQQNISEQFIMHFFQYTPMAQ